MTLHVVASGCASALGLDSPRTVASLRAGTRAFRLIPFWGRDEEDLLAAPIRGFAEGITDVERYVALAEHAVRPCWDALPPGVRAQAPIYVGLPVPDRIGVPVELRDRFVALFAARLGARRQQIFPLMQGRTAVFVALRQALIDARQGKLSDVLVGGVDCLVNPSSLRGLSAQGKLKESWDGFIPGEAAAFLRLSTAGQLGSWGGQPAGVRGCGIAIDEADGTAENPRVGVGVCAAMRSAVEDAGVSEPAVNFWHNDVSGARADFEDAAMGFARFFRAPRDSIPMSHLASFLGETGAAAGALALLWASASTELGFCTADGLLLSASEGPNRAAIFVAGGKPSATAKARAHAASLGEPLLREAVIEPAPLPSTQGLHLTEVDDLHGALIVNNFGELAWLCQLRQHHHAESGDPWGDIAGFETRLLAHLDALLWSGSQAQQLAWERFDSEDLDDVPAAAMLLLCQPLSAVDEQRLLETVTASPLRAAAIGSVLPHLPRQAAEPLLRGLLMHQNPSLCIVGLHALSQSGPAQQGTHSSAAPCQTPSLEQPDGLLRAALFAQAAAGTLQRADGESFLLRVLAMAELPSEGSPWLAPLITADTLARHGATLIAQAPLALALAGLRDGRSLLARLERDFDWLPVQLLDAIGWSGETVAQGLLLRHLQAPQPAQRSRAAEALQRIYGCGPLRKVRLPSTPLEDELELGEPQGRGRERLCLSEDPTEWERALYALPAAAERAILRHGRPWHRASSLDHLARPALAFAERMTAAWEYAVVNRAALPLHPAWFISRQLRALRSFDRVGAAALELGR